MDLKAKFRAWINENAPVLKQVYQNKYVEMLYDRFASYPANKQKQFVYAGFFTILLFVSLFLFGNFWSLLMIRSKILDTKEVTQTVLKFKQTYEEKKSELKNLENGQLQELTALKKAISDQAKSASISQRFVQVEEIPQVGEKKDTISARIRLQRVNLTQLKSFLEQLEFGSSPLSVNSARLIADDKVKGYINAEIGITVYIIKSEEGG